MSENTQRKSDLFFNRSRAPNGGIVCAYLKGLRSTNYYKQKAEKVNPFSEKNQN